MRTIFVLFGGCREAGAAAEELIGKGFDREEMNVIVRTAAVRARMAAGPGTIPAGSAPRAEKGRLRGMDLLLSGSKPVTIPGAGAAYAAGKTAAAAAGAAWGEPGKALALALADIGVPGELAELYESGVAEGGVLFWLRVAEERLAEASGVLAGTMDRKVANYD